MDDRIPKIEGSNEHTRRSTMSAQEIPLNHKPNKSNVAEERDPTFDLQMTTIPLSDSKVDNMQTSTRSRKQSTTTPILQAANFHENSSRETKDKNSLIVTSSHDISVLPALSKEIVKSEPDGEVPLSDLQLTTGNGAVSPEEILNWIVIIKPDNKVELLQCIPDRLLIFVNSITAKEEVFIKSNPSILVGHRGSSLLIERMDKLLNAKPTLPIDSTSFTALQQRCLAIEQQEFPHSCHEYEARVYNEAKESASQSTTHVLPIFQASFLQRMEVETDDIYDYKQKFEGYTDRQIIEELDLVLAQAQQATNFFTMKICSILFKNLVRHIAHSKASFETYLSRNSRLRHWRNCVIESSKDILELFPHFFNAIADDDETDGDVYFLVVLSRVAEDIFLYQIHQPETHSFSGWVHELFAIIATGKGVCKKAIAPDSIYL